MGNYPVPFKRLSEENSPPLKVGFGDSHSTSVEMEPLQPVNGNNKWHRTYTRFDTQAKGWTYGRFKPWLVIIACCLFILFVVVTLTALTVFKLTKTPDDIFASKQDIFELHFLMNESLDNIIQRLNNQSKQTGCNNSHVLQLQDQLNVFQEQLKGMQSIDVTHSSQVDIIQRNLSDLSKLARTLQRQVDTLSRKYSLEQGIAHQNVTELTKKVSRLEEFAANLSSAQQKLENLFRTNMSTLFIHVQNDMSSISDTQDHFSKKITSLQHNVSQLSSQLNAIHSSVQQVSPTNQDDTSLSNRVSDLESRLSTLSRQIHNPVKLYQNCREDTTSCTIDPDRSHTDYWRDCPTKYLPIHQKVCYGSLKQLQSKYLFEQIH